nr:hypothetical protein Iba_chr12aCG13230 [Ipomoea batatas]
MERRRRSATEALRLSPGYFVRRPRGVVAMASVHPDGGASRLQSTPAVTASFLQSTACDLHFFSHGHIFFLLFPDLRPGLVITPPEVRVKGEDRHAGHEQPCDPVMCISRRCPVLSIQSPFFFTSLSLGGLCAGRRMRQWSVRRCKDGDLCLSPGCCIHMNYDNELAARDVVLWRDYYYDVLGPI